MTTRTPCPRCGYLLRPYHLSRHMGVCEKVPAQEEMARVAKTMTVAELAREWGVNESTLAQWLRRLGIKAKQWRKNTPLAGGQRDQIVELYNGAVSVKDIADRLNTVEELVSPAISLMLAAGRIEKRKRPHGMELDLPRCSVCKIWLFSTSVPTGEGKKCGFCVGPEPGLEIMIAGGAEKLAEDVLVMGDRDARSSNGHRARARRWLKSDGVDYWLDLLDCNLDYIKGRLEAVA